MSGRDQADPAGATDVAENVHPMPGVAQPAHGESDRNPGTGFEPDWVEDIRVNLSAAERRAATLVTPPHRQEGLAGRLAAEGDQLHRPDHAFRR